MIRADLKHCGKIPDAREELNRSVREGRIENRHYIFFFIFIFLRTSGRCNRQSEFTLLHFTIFH